MIAPLKNFPPRRLLLRALTVVLAVSFSAGQALAGDHDHHEGEEEHGHEEHGHEEGGHIELSAEALGQLGVSMETAGPGTLKLVLPLTGKLVPHEDTVLHITPRYPGIIREVRKRLGDPVEKGEVVAVVESNQSLQLYEVKSLMAGRVVGRHANAGEVAVEANPIFEVADYRELYADFFVFPIDFGKIRPGQKVIVRLPDQGRTATSVISYLSPAIDPDTQSRFVRAVLDNTDGVFLPGMFVAGDIVLGEIPVPVAASASALRTVEGKPAVFVEEEEGRLVPRAVVVGRRANDSVEILEGLKPGERYAAGNTFILQAELEKGEAEHQH